MTRVIVCPGAFIANVVAELLNTQFGHRFPVSMREDQLGFEVDLIQPVGFKSEQLTEMRIYAQGAMDALKRELAIGRRM